MGARVAAWLVLLTLTAASGQISRPIARPDPARDAVRIEVRLVTDARFASVRVLAPLFASGEGRRLTGPADLRTAVLENLLAFSGNVEGAAASGAWRCVLGQVTPDAVIRWRLNVQGAHHATFEVYNINDDSNPRLVDRFEGGVNDEFTSSATGFRAGGPIALPSPVERLVLGFYFPWYDRATWSDPQLLDQPLRIYSTDEAADMLRELQDAQRAGLDGVIVSFQGKDTGGGFNHRRMLLVLQAAQQIGMKVSVQIETLAAHPPDQAGPPQAVTIAQWLTDIADLYGGHPSYLKVDGRPAVFLYAWAAAPEDVWVDGLARVRRSGRPLYVLADTGDPTALRDVDAIYTFGGSLSAPDIDAFSLRESLVSRTWHLLGPDRGAPRPGIVTVTPGFDDTGLRDRSNPFVVDREGGSFYERQWSAAAASGPSWVLVTTWNEWWENTEIEPGQKYGDAYLRRTEFWADVFHSQPPNDGGAAPR